MAAMGVAITTFRMCLVTMQTAVEVAVHPVRQSKLLFSGSCSMLQQLHSSARGTDSIVPVVPVLLHQFQYSARQAGNVVNLKKQINN